MSVMQLNPENFTKMVNAMSKFSHKFNYGSVIFTSDITPRFQLLQVLNAKSYSERYEMEEFAYTPFKKISKEEYKNIPALLKSLQCLKYNIEIEEKDMSYDEKNAYTMLNDYIEQIKNYIISQIPEYEESAWAM